MGRAKDGMNDWHDKVSIMKGIAHEAGSLSYCEDHDEYMDELNEEPAYDLVVEKFKRGDLGMFKDLAEAKAAMAEVFLETGEECGRCEYNKRQ